MKHWAVEIVRELQYVKNIIWYIKACLTQDNEFTSIYHIGEHSPYIIMSDLERHSIYPSIVDQARKTYNDMYRLSTGRVSIINCDVDSAREGKIFCYDEQKRKFQVHLDSSSGRPEIKYFKPEQLSASLDTLKKTNNDTSHTRHFSLIQPPNSGSSTARNFDMTFNTVVFDQLPKSSTSYLILDTQETYLTFEAFHHRALEVESKHNTKTIDSNRKRHYNGTLDEDISNHHILSLPFKTVDQNMIVAGRNNGEYDRTSDTKFTEAALLRSIGRQHIVINRDTLRRLEPHGKLNDDIVNLALAWLTAGMDDVICFKTYFLTELMQKGGINKLVNFTTNRDMNIMKKKILIFPYHSPNHWSTFAIINPGCIKSAYTGNSNQATKPAPCILLLDSNDAPSQLRTKRVAGYLRNWLNRMWHEESSNPYTKETPFSRHTIRLCIPKVVVQSNGSDDAIYMLRFVQSIVSSRSLAISIADIKNNFQDIITRNKSFNFGDDDVYNSRIHLHNLISNLSEMFNSCRVLSVANMEVDHEGESSSIDDSTQAISQSSAESKSQDSSWEMNCQKTVNGSTVDGDVTLDTALDNSGIDFASEDEMKIRSTILLSGYEIQYQPFKVSSHNFVKSAIIRSITDLGDGIGYKLMLDNHDQIDPACHKLCISKFIVPSSKVLIPNPDPIWMQLHEFTIVPSITKPSPSEEAVSDTKRLRLSRGLSNYQLQNKRSYILKQISQLDLPQPTSIYWNGIDSKQKKSATRSINDLYKKCLNFGKKERFYLSKITESKDWTDFCKKKNSLQVTITQVRVAGGVNLDIKSEIKYYRGVNDDAKSFTMRHLKVREAIFAFEYKNKCRTIKVCPSCKENVMLALTSEEARKECFTDASKHNKICEKCKKRTKNEPNYYVDKNLHPVWYRRDEHGEIIMGPDGKPVPQYDIPQVLTDLTMAEKLLIRRYAPFIPTQHIRNGVYGIKGHCVTFPQDITGVCNELPRQQKSVVTFIRHLSNKDHTESLPKQLKVRRDKVLNALRWLKIHHVGYHSITILESNLDWMENDACKNIAELGHIISIEEHKKIKTVSEEEEFVSGAHAVDDTDNEMNVSTMHINERKSVPPPDKATQILELIESKNEQGKLGDCLSFPSIDVNQPAS